MMLWRRLHTSEQKQPNWNLEQSCANTHRAHDTSHDESEGSLTSASNVRSNHDVCGMIARRQQLEPINH